MMNKSSLYFIALIPHESLKQQVFALKQELKQNYGAKVALKSPAHITLQRPFRRDESFEKLLCNALSKVSNKQQSFNILLNGFGCFAPRVIYIKPHNMDSIQGIHKLLIKELSQIGFDMKEMNEQINPHMTIATRDLNESNFEKAWSIYENQEFSDSFVARSVFLLKHNGKTWDVIREFDFANQNLSIQ